MNEAWNPCGENAPVRVNHVASKTVLIVAYYFPPIATSGSMRPLGFCRYLGKYGWGARVLTTEPTSVYPFLGIDETLCARLPANIQIDRVSHINPERTCSYIRERLLQMLCAPNLLTHHGLRLMANGRRSSVIKSSSHSGYQSIRKCMLDWLFAFPDRQRFWLGPAVRRLAQLPAHEQPDVIYATGGPWSSLLVGKALARNFGIPFVADFRDPWTSNPNQQELSAFLFRRSQELERSICTVAERVIANTDALRDHFMHTNPELKSKFVTITNGFDRDESKAIAVLDYKDRGMPTGAALEICHFGSISGNRVPFALFSAVSELFKANQIKPGQLRIRLVGDWVVNDKECESLAEELEKDTFLRRERSVPHDDCLSQMASANILLILQPGYPLQVPAKIYEYIAAGRPILVIGGEGATKSLVERHRLGKCCSNDVSAIKESLLLLVTGRFGIEPSPPEEREKFHYNALTRQLAEVLNTISSDPPHGRRLRRQKT